MSAAERVRLTVDGDSPVAEASGRPVKTRRNRRPDRRRVKLLRSYTIDEVARTLGVHRNTVRQRLGCVSSTKSVRS
jgi:hypothetical protein